MIGVYLEGEGGICPQNEDQNEGEGIEDKIHVNYRL
jgi:hypothetical protein